MTPNPNLKRAELRAAAYDLTRQRHGDDLTVFLPAMFRLNGVTGRYPAVSITGDECSLGCDHCAGAILRSMISTTTPQALLERCLDLAEKGQHGVLLSGGCDPRGMLPWADFLPVIERIKRETDLIVTVHSGLVDRDTALGLKQAGADQALIDVIGDDETFQRVYHVDFGVDRIAQAMAHLAEAGLPMVPHIVCGLNYGRIVGEFNALTMISEHLAHVEQVVVVSLMTIPSTPMAQTTPKTTPPAAELVGDLLAKARLSMPDTRLSLGCARQRGNHALELLAIDAGVNRLALPSDEALDHARARGLRLRYQTTCCSVSDHLAAGQWT